jgi:hypothetical protein
VTRPVVLAIAPWLGLALAREIEGALALVLHGNLEGADVVGAAVRTLDAGPLAAHALGWTVAGILLWMTLAISRARSDGQSFREAATSESWSFAALLLIPLTTTVALLALLVQPTWPYGHTLAVALTQDLAPARDALAIAAVLALRAPAPSLPAPRASGVLFVSFLAYALLTPGWARNWDNHPGNEPKYLRMAVALSHRLSFDVEPVSAPMEELQPEPFGQALTAAARGLVWESGRMLAALSRGPAAVGREAITATRITRQTVGGKDGGVFHVLAPGPSLLIAPTLRIDRALNRAYETPGRLAASVLLVNLLGALLVMATFQLVRDATGRAGLGAALAFGFAFVPPFLFYFFQFYPEMPGALVLAVLFRLVFLKDSLSRGAALGAGLLLASLPWLHQKFLPVWAVLAATALIRAWQRRASRGDLIALAAPQLVSLYLTALYNFGITGSVRPDSLFLAWGPAGVTTARLGQGLLGLWLDARYGLLPYAPAYALAAAGLLMPGEGPMRLRRALPAALVYYLTVAAADNWAGAVCNLGRYLMPVLPLGVAFAGVALAGVGSRRGAWAIALALCGVTALFALALWRDPLAANDSALLLARSRFADGLQYIPGLFIRTWAAGAPGLVVRIAVWALGLAGLACWLRRAADGHGGDRPFKAALVALGLVLSAAALLERWPSSRTGPVFPEAVALADGRMVFPEGPLRRQDDLLEVRSGVTTFIVRMPGDTSESGGGGRARGGSTLSDISQDKGPESAALFLLVGGAGRLKLPDRQPLVLRPQGALVALPLEIAVTLTDRTGGHRQTLLRQAVTFEGDAPAVVRFPEVPETGELPQGPVR